MEPQREGRKEHLLLHCALTTAASPCDPSHHLNRQMQFGRSNFSPVANKVIDRVKSLFGDAEVGEGRRGA